MPSSAECSAKIGAGGAARAVLLSAARYRWPDGRKLVLVEEIGGREDEHLTHQVRVLLVSAHEPDHALARGVFDDLRESIAHDLLELRRLRQRAHDAGAHMREEILPVAQALEQNGIRYPALVARLGADTYAYIEQWLTQLEGEESV